MKFKFLSVLCGVFAALAVSVTAHAADTHGYSIKSGIYDEPQIVWMNVDEDIDIFYTTDGSVPSDVATPLVKEIPIIVTESTRIRCVAYKDGVLVENSALTVRIRTDKPCASVDGGSYTEPVRVKLTCADEDAVIYYTTDGSAPDESSKQYTKPLFVNTDAVIRFAAYGKDHAASRIVTEEYSIGAAYEDERCQQLFDLLNEVRAQYGLAALETMPQLSDIAQQRAGECASYFSHYRADGTKWDYLLAKAGLKRNMRAENIAYYYPTAKQVLNGWMNSTYHRANILDADARYIGVGCYGSGNNIYWALLFIGEE